MLKKFSLLLVLLVIALLIAGCGGKSEPSSYSDPSQPIKVKAGSEFVIALESNPTTGYSWEENSDSTLVQLTGQEYKPDEAEEQVTGSGGTDYFTYKALQAGETMIEMIHGQHWDGGDVEEPLIFKVTVE
jgi:inhibitor of cysteine peptidase